MQQLHLQLDGHSGQASIQLTWRSSEYCSARTMSPPNSTWKRECRQGHCPSKNASACLRIFASFLDIGLWLAYPITPAMSVSLV